MLFVSISSNNCLKYDILILKRIINSIYLLKKEVQT